DVESRVEIRAFISEGSSVEPVADAMGVIGNYKEVRRVDYVSPEQALERARKEMGEFQDVFEGNFLPGSLDIRLREGYRDPATVKRIADTLSTFDFIDDVRYGEEW